MSIDQVTSEMQKLTIANRQVSISTINLFMNKKYQQEKWTDESVEISEDTYQFLLFLANKKTNVRIFLDGATRNVPVLILPSKNLEPIG